MFFTCLTNLIFHLKPRSAYIGTLQIVTGELRACRQITIFQGHLLGLELYLSWVKAALSHLASNHVQEDVDPDRFKQPSSTVVRALRSSSRSAACMSALLPLLRSRACRAS